MAAQRGLGRAATHLLAACVLVMAGPAVAQQPAAPPPSAPLPAASDSTLDLAKKTQNPIADLISLPLQSNLNFGYGAKDAPTPAAPSTCSTSSP
jgi:hypothetical protein